MTKTLDEIKKGLNACAHDLNCNSCPYKGFRCTRLLMQDADDALRQLESQVPRWISVEERLPRDNENVLVYCIGNNEDSVVAMTSYTHRMYGYNIEGWRSPWQYFFDEYKITHWMPLPEPPVEV